MPQLHPTPLHAPAEQCKYIHLEFTFIPFLFSQDVIDPLWSLRENQVLSSLFFLPLSFLDDSEIFCVYIC